MGLLDLWYSRSVAVLSGDLFSWEEQAVVRLNCWSWGLGQSGGREARGFVRFTGDVRRGDSGQES